MALFVPIIGGCLATEKKDSGGGRAPTPLPQGLLQWRKRWRGPDALAFRRGILAGSCSGFALYYNGHRYQQVRAVARRAVPRTCEPSAAKTPRIRYPRPPPVPSATSDRSRLCGRLSSHDRGSTEKKPWFEDLCGVMLWRVWIYASWGILQSETGRMGMMLFPQQIYTEYLLGRMGKF